MYSSILGISIIIMIIAVIFYDNNDRFLEVVKNLAFGCVASTLVALLIEVENVKENNEKANSVYDAVYIDLQCQIKMYLETWACLCSIAFKDKDYCHEKHTWVEWYDITKSKFLECDDRFSPNAHFSFILLCNTMYLQRRIFAL